MPELNKFMKTNIIESYLNNVEIEMESLHSFFDIAQYNVTDISENVACNFVKKIFQKNPSYQFREKNLIKIFSKFPETIRIVNKNYQHDISDNVYFVAKKENPIVKEVMDSENISIHEY
jgi:hypothetical protein